MVRILSLALVAAVAACSAGGSPPPRKPKGLAKQYWQEGGSLARRGDLDGAIRKYKQALEQEPEYIQALNDLGHVYIQKGWHGKAIGLFEKAIRINPDFVEPRAGMAEAYYALDNFDQSLEEASKAIEDAPGFARAWYWRGLARLRKGSPEMAEKDLVEATRLDSRLAPAQLALGELYAGNGIYGKAERRFQAALDASPNSIQVYGAWASMKMRQGEWDAAYQLLKRGVARSPRTAWLRTHLGMVLLQRGKLALDRGDEETFRGETEAAMEQFKQALRFDRTDADARVGLEEARERLAKVR